MGWLWAIVVGLVLGVIARAILPGRQAIPLWLTVIYGIIGGLLGNAVASGIGVRHTSGVDWIRHLLQLAGAVLVVAVGSPLWQSIRGRNRNRSPR
ncbi:GlsB/YeaQ/YmgE family stress response membrane protein [Streptomyces sp. SL13]|uniref:GlsB/YeaQ/YmgE family stress response membrane protein n=1 Tax=Streptantibioticus silvisoli TaxID=2705255 RepID=A0AA90KBE9_9ACTN|nr:GlsB/YeaQ/YmgE family stress response membrane protein [Streptantibioticus silvisoli]MDI5963083.1 GlsB/YeaQ/YmgE family stress response membrane protein [Streptantibioticus silvisoli]MDI5973227.1 GlsB/YeaQ/YmgE family stress response membrane protein [Streptantibioticus silvisoli]